MHMAETRQMNDLDISGNTDQWNVKNVTALD